MRDTPESVMIFAAGFGTRMGALTAERPKPLIPVAGRPLIDHAIDIVRALGTQRIVANTHYLADMIEAHLVPKGIQISREDPEILETGGGLRKALPLLGSAPVMTLNPDVVWTGPNPLNLLNDAWDATRMDALLLCLEPENAIGRTGGGDFSITQGGLLSRGGPLIFGGAQILQTGGLAEIKETSFSLNLLWDRMIEKGRLFGLSYPGKWCDVGRPEGIVLAETLLGDHHV